jgi:hypothetical protein
MTLNENKGLIGVVIGLIALLTTLALLLLNGPVDDQRLAGAGPLQGATCFNGLSCDRNLQDIIKSSTNNYTTNGVWNHTQLWSGGECTSVDGIGCLWVPWFTSSSSCRMAGNPTGDLHTYGTSSCQSNNSLNVNVTAMVTDELSEIGTVLCVGNASVEPLAVAYMNLLDSVAAVCSLNGDLNGWSQCKNLTDIQCLDSNSASDANHRISTSLYLCGNNSAFSEGNRTRANNLASKYMNESIRYETTGPNVWRATDYYGNLTYWLFAGGNQAAFSASGEEDQYGGYYGDALLACLAHANYNRQNTTLPTICTNWTAQFLAMADYRGGTAGSDFRSPFYRIWFNVTDGYVHPSPPSAGYNSYYSGSGGRCDDADCPRFMNICHAADMANKTQFYNMSAAPWKNLTDYCTAFSHNSGWLATTIDAQACQSWNGTGSCVTGPYDSVQLTGMLIASLTYINRTQFVNVSSELNRHWSWSGMRIQDGGVTCGSGLSYSHVRWPKSFIYANGIDENLYTNYTVAASETDYITVTSSNVNATSVVFNGSIRLNATVTNTTSEDISSVKATLRYPNGTLTNVTLTRLLTNVTQTGASTALSVNFSFCATDQGFSGYDVLDTLLCALNKTTDSGNIFSPDLDLETNFSSTRVQVLMRINYTNGTNNKIHPTEVCGSTPSNNRFNLENVTSSTFHVKADRGTYSSTGNYPYNVTVTMNFTTVRNSTGNYSRACITTDCTSWEVFAPDAGAEDCIAIEFSNLRSGKLILLGVNVSNNGTTGVGVDVTINTSNYAVNLTGLNNSGTYNITQLIINTTGGHNETNASYPTYFVVNATNTGPNVTLRTPLNGSNVTSNTVTLNWSVFDDTDSSLSCALYTNRTSSWAINTTVNVTNGSNYQVSVLFGNGTFIWNALCNDTSGNSTWAANNFTFSVVPIVVNINVTMCANINNIRFLPNVSAGIFNPNTNTYSEYGIVPVNHSACGYDFVMNNTNASVAQTTFYTNLSDENITLSVNGMKFNTSQNATVNVTNGTVGYMNLSVNITNAPLTRLRLSFSINYTGVVFA